MRNHPIIRALYWLEGPGFPVFAIACMAFVVIGIVAVA